MNDVILNLPKEEVVIDYTNWRGERAMRRVRPLSVRFEATEWHPDQQWLLRAVDVERGHTRDFAMSNIHSWQVPTSLNQQRDVAHKGN
jgi:predicted DNA-binding transcriptional regulator YafY